MATTDEAIRECVDSIDKSRAMCRAGDVATVYDVMLRLRELPYPSAYLDCLQGELLGFLTSNPPSVRFYAASVYLAFFGPEDRAEYLKIGIAKHVEGRLTSHATSNPMENLWSFAAGFETRKEAAKVERVLLRHVAQDRARGEWVYVRGLSGDAARAMAQSLAEVAGEAIGRQVIFDRLDG